MDDGGGNGGGSFKVKHGSYAAEVTNVHEAGAVGDVVGERPRQPPAYAPHRSDGENRRLGMGIGIEGEPHSKPQLQVTPSCIPQFATMKRNWWPNAGPIVERIR